MFIRIFFIFKSAFNYSIYANPYSKRVCKDNGFYPTTWFIFKGYMQSNPIKTFSCMFFTSVFVFSSWYLVFELEDLIKNPETRVETPYFNCVYVTMITMTSLGYGDMVPRTVTGKIVVAFMSLWGAILIAFLVQTVQYVFTLNDRQANAMSQI